MKIHQQIRKIKAKGESIILLGDMNAHVGDLVQGNKSNISFGGKLIREFLEDDDFVLLNAAKVSTGGPFTRVDPVNESCLSLLDLCIVSSDLFPYVESFTVDNDRKSTPYRALSKTKVKYSDHFSLIIKFVNLPFRNKRKFTH